MEIEALITRTHQFLKSPKGKKYSLYAAGVVAAIIALGLIGPFFYSHSYLKQKLTFALEERLGREVKIAGDIRVRVFPWPGIDAKDIIIDNPRNVGGKEKFAVIRDIRVDFAFFKFLTGETHPVSVQIINSDINLQIGDKNNPNWIFPRSPKEKRLPFDSKQLSNGFDLTLYLLKALPYGLMPDEVILKNSKITYQRNGGDRITINDVSNTITQDRPNTGVKIKGNGLLDNEGVDWFAAASNIRAFSTKERSSLKMSYAHKQLNIGITGSIERDVYKGRASINVTSLRSYIPTLLEYSPFNQVVSPLEFNLSADNTECASSYCNFNGTFQIDKIGGRIEAQTKFNSDLPEIRLVTYVKNADLNSFLAEPLPDNMKLSTEIQDEEKQNIVWSDVPIDLSVLHLARIRLELKINRLVLRGLELGKGLITLVANENGVEFNVADTEMYSGRGTISLTGDYKESPIKWTGMTNLSNVDLTPITNQILGIRSFQGKSNLLLNFTAIGDHSKAVVSSIDGTGILYSKNNRLRGLDIAAMFRNLPSAFNPQSMARQTTEFENLNANFTLNDGVLENTDLSVNSRFLQFSGRGKVDFVNSKIDYVLLPQRIIRLDKNAGIGSRISYPLMVKGPLKAPVLTPNLQKPLKNDPSFKSKTAAPKEQPEAKAKNPRK